MSEERLQHIEEKIDDLDKKVDRKVDALDEKVDAIDKDLAKYRGLVGGVLLVVTAIVTFVKLTWDWLVKHVTIS